MYVILPFKCTYYVAFSQIVLNCGIMLTFLERVEQEIVTRPSATVTEDTEWELFTSQTLIKLDSNSESYALVHRGQFIFVSRQNCKLLFVLLVFRLLLQLLLFKLKAQMTFQKTTQYIVLCYKCCEYRNIMVQFLSDIPASEYVLEKSWKMICIKECWPCLRSMKHMYMYFFSIILLLPAYPTDVPQLKATKQPG